MIHIKAPNDFSFEKQKIVFLAGSIEMGTAEPWQERFVKEFEGQDVIFINPRREDWDMTWEGNDPRFIKHVDWELSGMETADLIVMYFDPNTKSPITLLELGLYAPDNQKKLFVCCPDKFWRKGNVQAVCKYYEVMLVHEFQELIDALKSKIKWK